MMKYEFKVTSIAYKGFQSFAAVAALLSTLSVWGVFPDVGEIPTSVTEALKSDVRPVASHRSIPVAATGAEEGRLERVLLIRDRTDHSDSPADESIFIRVKPGAGAAAAGPQEKSPSPCPKASENATVRMSEWGNIDCLEADQLSLLRFVSQGSDSWSSQGLGSEHQQLELEILYRVPGTGATDSKELSDASTRLLIVPRWKVERFRIVAVLHTLVLLATIGLACLVAFEAYQYLMKRDTIMPSYRGREEDHAEPEETAPDSDDLEDDEDYLLRVPAPNACQPSEAG